MTHTTLRLLALTVAILPTSAFAHAHLHQAVPAAGSTVTGGPSDLALTYSEGVVAKFSTVQVTTSSGAAVAADKPTVEAADPKVLHVHIEKPLAPGSYTVRWHVVATDTHATSGSYKFTVAP